jgi:hypothetical protein
MTLMEVKLKTEDARRIVYNALLYADQKSDAQGYTLWERNFAPSGNGDYLTVVTSDDFVILMDHVPIISSDINGPLTLTREYLKLIHKALANITDDEVTLELGDHCECSIEHILGDYQDVVLGDERINIDSPPDDFAFWPDRLRKLSQIKPGKQPLKFHWYEGVLRFNIGDDIFGALAPLDLDKVED